MEELLDLTSASLGAFKLRAPWDNRRNELSWPKQIKLGAVFFSEMGVGRYSSHEDRNGVNVLEETPDETSAGLQFHGRPEFSESAYSSYEQTLRSRGQFSEADEAYRAMHGHKRDQIWRGATGLFPTLGAAFLSPQPGIDCDIHHRRIGFRHGIHKADRIV